MRKIVYYLFVLIAVASSAAAKSKEPYYIAPSQVSLSEILDPIPAPGSEAQKKDMRAVLNAERSRTEEQVKSAQADAEVSVFRFAGVLGPNFDPESVPFTKKFFERVTSDEVQAIRTAKKHFNRPRPFVVSQDIHPIIKQPSDASYPSGHTTFAYLIAIILAKVVPEKSAALFERAAVYSHNRVVAGVHFPTDVEAGRIASSVIANTLLHEGQFINDLVQAKAEVRRTLNLD